MIFEKELVFLLIDTRNFLFYFIFFSSQDFLKLVFCMKREILRKSNLFYLGEKKILCIYNESKLQEREETPDIQCFFFTEKTYMSCQFKLNILNKKAYGSTFIFYNITNYFCLVYYHYIFMGLRFYYALK